MSTVSENNVRILKKFYGISEKLIASVGREQSLNELKSTTVNMVRDVNTTLHDYEIGVSEASDSFGICIDLPEFNGDWGEYDLLKLRMNDTFLSLMADAINAAEQKHASITAMDKNQYIQSIADFIRSEIYKYARFTDLMSETVIVERLQADMSDDSFTGNNPIYYFDRFLAITDSLSLEFWGGVSDDIIAGCLRGAEKKLLEVATKLELFEVLTDNKDEKFYGLVADMSDMQEAA